MAAAALLLTACSGSPDSSDEPGLTEAPSSSTSASEAAAEGSASPSAASTGTPSTSTPSPGTPFTGPVPFPLDASIPALQRAMRNGRVTALELVDLYLARIAAYDDAGPAVNALISINPRARDEAAALDAERAESGPRGPLHGIPVVVKDNIDTAEMPTTAGALALEHFIPAEDAFQVRKLREAGAIILAKANLAELAQSWRTISAVGGETLNPYDTTRGPGGSSGGTAAAVTANFATVGLGTDTCGSNRLPAGMTNLYGLRPTSGRSSRAGVIPFSSTLDEVGPMARTVMDLAIVLEATAGQDPADPTTVPHSTSFVDAVDTDGLAGRRIGVATMSSDDESFSYDGLDGSLQAALDTMVDSGAELVEVRLPGRPHDVLIEFMREFPYALRSYLAAEPTAPVGVLDQLVEEDTDQLPASQPRTPAYRHALATRPSLRRQIEALMERRDLDAIAYPVSGTTALELPEYAGHWDCAEAAVSGLPALAMPAGFAADGLPVGLELMGRPFDEATLISIAAGYEAQTDHRRLPPSTPPQDATP